MWKSTLFGVEVHGCTSCNSHHNLNMEVFITLQNSPVLFLCSYSFPSPTLLHSNLPCLKTISISNFASSRVSYKWRHYDIHFESWLFKFSIMHLKFIHVIYIYSLFLFIAEYSPIVHMYHSLSIQQLKNIWIFWGHKSINIPTVNILIQVFVWT